MPHPVCEVALCKRCGTFKRTPDNSKSLGCTAQKTVQYQLRNSVERRLITQFVKNKSKFQGTNAVDKTVHVKSTEWGACCCFYS